MNGNTGFIVCQGYRQARCHQAQQCMGWPTSPDANSVSLRDQFAMAAMQGMINSEIAMPKPADMVFIAATAYEMADAMLAERSK